MLQMLFEASAAAELSVATGALLHRQRVWSWVRLQYRQQSLMCQAAAQTTQRFGEGRILQMVLKDSAAAELKVAKEAGFPA